jgi:hypothetical protein
MESVHNETMMSLVRVSVSYGFIITDRFVNLAIKILVGRIRKTFYDHFGVKTCLTTKSLAIKRL